VDAESKLIVNLTRGGIVCERTTIANRSLRRMRGLLGRRSLPPGEAMLLQPAPSIHTACMRFPIDAVFLDGTLRVVKVVEHLRPWRIASAHRASTVLELSCDEIAERGIEVGDQLGVIEITDRLGAFGSCSEPEHDDPRSIGESTNDGRRDDPEAHRSRCSSFAEPVAPPRVLLLASDRRFRCVTATLLTRRGCAVILGDRRTNAAELARRERADVVVLDVGSSLTAAAHDAAQIEALEPRLGVILVGDEPKESLAAMPVLAKWGSFDVLFGAIERAHLTRNRGVSDAVR
jgi:uncharacterized membrane protein (UPF0127 family)